MPSDQIQVDSKCGKKFHNSFCGICKNIQILNSTKRIPQINLRNLQNLSIATWSKSMVEVFGESNAGHDKATSFVWVQTQLVSLTRSQKREWRKQKMKGMFCIIVMHFGRFQRKIWAANRFPKPPKYLEIFTIWNKAQSKLRNKKWKRRHKMHRTSSKQLLCFQLWYWYNSPVHTASLLRILSCIRRCCVTNRECCRVQA